MSLNNVVLMGRLCADPELRKTNIGASVLSARIACDRDFKPKDSDKIVDFFDVVCWRNNADYMAKWGEKGRKVCVVGTLQNREWEDKNGIKRTTTEVQVERIYFCDNKQKDTAPAQYAPQVQAQPDDYINVTDEDDDTPF